MKYQNMRGGRVQLQDVRKPAKDDWGTPLEVLETSLEMEKAVNEALLNLHVVAENSKDPQMMDYLERTHCTTFCVSRHPCFYNNKIFVSLIMNSDLQACKRLPRLIVYHNINQRTNFKQYSASTDT